MLRRLQRRAVAPFVPRDTNTGQRDSTETAVESGSLNPHEKFPPAPVDFWHPSLREVRNRAFGKWIVTTAFLMAFILAVLSIYWGLFYQMENRLKHLRVFVVDFDGQPPYDNGVTPFVGPTITRMTQQLLNSNKPTLGFDILTPAHFHDDTWEVRQAVYDFGAWAAIIINPNATAMLYSAIASGNTSYDPTGACQLVYQDARDDTNWNSFMLPILGPYMTHAQEAVGEEWARLILQNASNPTTLRNMQAAPQAVNPAIGFSAFNLRPFYPSTATPAVSIGLIYLIIVSFFSFAFYLPIHMQYVNPKNHPPLKFYQLIIWRWCATMSAYIFLSLAYSFVSMAFQLNFTRTNPVTSDTQVTDIAYGNSVAYGHGTFPVYWMLNFWGMVALGMACENVAMIVGAPWMGLWLIFWVITNVSTSFYDIQVLPAFYRWGYAWPLHSGKCYSRLKPFDSAIPNHPRMTAVSQALPRF